MLVLKDALPAFSDDSSTYLRQIELDSLEYGVGARVNSPSAPLRFDVIDTSNLADSFGTLNLLVAGTTLMKGQPSSTIRTEMLAGDVASDAEDFRKLLEGDTLTVAAFLGLQVSEYYTNATMTPYAVDGILLAGLEQLQQQQRVCLTWKPCAGWGTVVGEARRSPLLAVSATGTAGVIKAACEKMFEHEDLASMLNNGGFMDMTSMKRRVMDLYMATAYAPSHRGSLTAFIKLLTRRIKTDWPAVFRNVQDSMAREKSTSLLSVGIQDFATHLHMNDIHQESWLSQLSHEKESVGHVTAWKKQPEVVALTVAVPRAKVAALFDTALSNNASPTLLVSIKSSTAAKGAWENHFRDVHLVWGSLETKGSRDSEDFSVIIKADPNGWEGASDLIASCYVPTAALLVEPLDCVVRLNVQTSLQNVKLFGKLLGEALTVYQTRLGDEAHVFVTRFQPGSQGFPCVGGKVRSHRKPDMIESSEVVDETAITVNVDESTGSIVSMVGRVGIFSEKGRRLLADKAPIQLRQTSPFAIDVVFGKGLLAYSLEFPAAVDKDKARTRIARTSSYVEVVSPLAHPLESTILSTTVSPTVLGQSSIPITSNISHTCLDSLPILDTSDKDKIPFATTIISSLFSPRERQLRNHVQSTSKAGISSDARLNFKESLMTMFMLSAGLQGEQTGLFGLSHAEDGMHMFIFISAIRIDAVNGSLVADAAVLPMAGAMKDVDSGIATGLDAFLSVLEAFKMCGLNVDDEELEVWKRTLPALVERCRTWNHLSNCEYSQDGASCPLTMEKGKQFLCSCGQGKLPGDFIGLPLWDQAAKFATRVAISLVFAAPFVENVVMTGMDSKSANTLSRTTREGCRVCGSEKGKDGKPLRKCAKCLSAKYCSPKCQRADWKTHRRECKEQEG
jgi:hypothetical protein